MGATDLTGWEPIHTAPMDGSAVRLRRVVGDHLVMEGRGKFVFVSSCAVALLPFPPDALGQLTDDIATIERRGTTERTDPQRAWMTADGRYRFPTPTHWRSDEGKGQ
jgi:hypothetical protein